MQYQMLTVLHVLLIVVVGTVNGLSFFPSINNIRYINSRLVSACSRRSQCMHQDGEENLRRRRRRPSQIKDEGATKTVKLNPSIERHSYAGLYGIDVNADTVPVYNVCNDKYCQHLYQQSQSGEVVAENLIQHKHIEFLGFDSLFPNVSKSEIGEHPSGVQIQISLSDLFHSNTSFRTQIRKAARLDFLSLQIKNMETKSTGKASRHLACDLKSTFMSYWRFNYSIGAPEIIYSDESDFQELTAVFSSFGFYNFTGSQFIGKLTR